VLLVQRVGVSQQATDLIGWFFHKVSMGLSELVQENTGESDSLENAPAGGFVQSLEIPSRFHDCRRGEDVRHPCKQRLERKARLEFSERRRREEDVVGVRGRED